MFDRFSQEKFATTSTISCHQGISYRGHQTTTCECCIFNTFSYIHSSTGTQTFIIHLMEKIKLIHFRKQNKIQQTPCQWKISISIVSQKV